jgi:hypothetical protein
MTLPITVITPSLHERSTHLQRSLKSVANQTLMPQDHLILVDRQRIGGWRPLNVLAKAVETEWTQILTDDDYLEPHHFENLWPLCAGADIVYSSAIAIGKDPYTGYDAPFDPEVLRRVSIVSHVALVRTSLIRELDGWKNEPGYDWTFWVRALDAGARFAKYNGSTWVYDLDGEISHESR